ncbi:hypothetical protein GCM10010222_04080 [Streptomyces tanashiensis]|nr:hypothetical protein GCM10010222_04080 [Streptomyces tanashiensis]
MVRERDDVQTGRGRVPDELGRGVRTVGGRGVGVQIDAHDAVLQGLGTDEGRSSITGESNTSVRNVTGRTAVDTP